MNARAVKTLEDVEMLRQIRNSGRQWMTRHTEEISPEQQRDWWKDACHDPSLDVWLFSVAQTDIGYGLLRIESGREWCSLAVLPRYQGQGYGTQIYRWIALSTTADVWAEILADNTASIKACLNAGYQVAYAMDKHAVLVHKK
jgi:RimJ/RimL family protein N-acetyltransferase